MRLLLDTHALVWWLTDDPALSRAASEAIAAPDSAVFVSAASAMELLTKHRSGKLPEAETLAHSFEAIVAAEHFLPVAISLRHATIVGRLRLAHKDPFDRLLVAQALVEGMPLVSNERVFDGLGVTRIW